MTGQSALAWTKLILMVVVVVAVGALGFWWYGKLMATVDKTKEIISDTLENLNPVNPGNIVYRGYSNIVSAAAGREESLGGWFYSITHADPVEQMKEQELEENSWNYQAQYLN